MKENPADPGKRNSLGLKTNTKSDPSPPRLPIRGTGFRWCFRVSNPNLAPFEIGVLEWERTSEEKAPFSGYSPGQTFNCAAPINASADRHNPSPVCSPLLPRQESASKPPSYQG